MAGETDIEILISVAQQSSAAMAELQDSLKKIVDQLAKLQSQPTDKPAEGIGKIRDKANQAESPLKKFGEGMEMLAKWTKVAVGGFVAFQSVQVVKEFAEAGAEVEALALGLRVVGENAGYTADEMKNLTKELEKIGLDDAAANKSLMKLIGAGISPEAARELAKSTRILANQTAQDVDRVFEVATRAILSGRTMMLKRMGIQINQEAILSAAVMAKGKDLTPEERNIALTKGVAEEIKRLRGGREAEGEELAATKVKDLAKAWDNVSEAIGATLQGPYKDLLDLQLSFARGLEEFINNVAPAAIQMFEYLGRSIAFVSEKVVEFKEVIILAAAGIAGWLAGGTSLVALLAGIVPLLIAAAAAAAVWLTMTEKGQAILITVAAALDLGIMKLEELWLGLKKTAAAWDIFWLEMLPGDHSEKIASLTADIKKVDEALASLKERQTEAAGVGFRARVDAKYSGDQTIKDARDLRSDPKNQIKDVEASVVALKEAEDRKLGLAKAGAEAAVTAAKHAYDMKKQYIDREMAANQFMFDEGLINLNEYYDRRIRAAQDLYEKERAMAKAATAKAATDAAAAVKEAAGKGNIEVVQAQQAAIVGAARKRELLVEEAHLTAMGKLKIDHTKALMAADSRATQNAIELKALEGDRIGAEIAQINEDEINALKTAADESDRATIKRIAQLKRVNAEIEHANQLMRVQHDIQNSILDRRQIELDAANRRGQVNDLEAMEQRAANIEERVTVLNVELARAIMDARAAAGTIGQAEAEAKIERIKTAIAGLKAEIVTMGDVLRDSFSTNLTSAINSFLTNSKNFKDAAKDFLHGLFNDVTAIISKNLSQNITRAIVENTGGGTGIFGVLGKLLTGAGTRDGSTPAKATYVQDVSKVLLDATGTNPLEKAEKELFETVKEGFMDLFKGFGDMMTDLGDTLWEFATTLFSALQSSSSGGGGGFFGSLLSMFGGGGGAGAGFGAASEGFGSSVMGMATMMAAEGGELTGPSHAQGGIPLTAEGGEFIVNKEATARNRALLESINREGGGGAPIGGRKRGAMFAGGGLVTAGQASSGGVSVSFTVDARGSSVAGDHEKSQQLGQALQHAVLTEIVRQKRPGGLLSGTGAGN